jgi:hypothetical protein
VKVATVHAIDVTAATTLALNRPNALIMVCASKGCLAEQPLIVPIQIAFFCHLRILANGGKSDHTPKIQTETLPPRPVIGPDRL